MRVSFLILILSLLVGEARAELRVPRTMAFGSSSFLTQGLGNSCFAFDLPADTLPCNPAFIAKERERRFRASFFFGNNVSYTKEASDLVRNEADSQTIEHLFAKKDNSELETNIEGGYWGETWGLAFSPFRLSYSSVFRNPSLPEVTVFASQEESLRGQFGSYLGNDFYWGVQLRALHRKFLAAQFFLTDAFTDSRDEIFAPKEQNVVYLEPSFLYSPEGSDWRPEISFGLLNLGFADRDYDAFPSLPQYHLSAAISPDVGWGRWGFGIDAFWDKDVETATEPLTLGTYYEFGILRVFGSIAEKAGGAGFSVLSGPFNLGLSYSSRTIKDAFGEEANFHRVYLLLGVEI